MGNICLMLTPQQFPDWFEQFNAITNSFGDSEQWCAQEQARHPQSQPKKSSAINKTAGSLAANSGFRGWIDAVILGRKSR
jgi:hypothetical protein